MLIFYEFFATFWRKKIKYFWQYFLHENSSFWLRISAKFGKIFFKITDFIHFIFRFVSSSKTSVSSIKRSIPICPWSNPPLSRVQSWDTFNYLLTKSTLNFCKRREKHLRSPTADTLTNVETLKSILGTITDHVWSPLVKPWYLLKSLVQYLNHGQQNQMKD